MRGPVSRWGVPTGLLIVASAVAVAGPADRRTVTVRLVRMADEQPAPKGEVTAHRAVAFLQHHRAASSSEGESLDARNRALTRQGLGQRALLEELLECERRLGIRLEVECVSRPQAFGRLQYLSRSGPPEPVIGQLGDSWLAYFERRGVVAWATRETWDTRLLWYRRDLFARRDLATGETFRAALQRVAERGVPGLESPFAIPSAPEGDLLQVLATFICAAGAESIAVEGAAGAGVLVASLARGPQRGGRASGPPVADRPASAGPADPPGRA